jgi:hypothetical protein
MTHTKIMATANRPTPPAPIRPLKPKEAIPPSSSDRYAGETVAGELPPDAVVGVP